MNATITDREGKSQYVKDIQLHFVKNNWVNVIPQDLRYFYLGIRYVDSGSYHFSEILFFPLDEIKEIDWKDTFETGVSKGMIIKKFDGTSVDIERIRSQNNISFLETISFFSSNGELIKAKKLDYYNILPGEKSDPHWMIESCKGLIEGDEKSKEYRIKIPHKVRRIVFHQNKK